MNDVSKQNPGEVDARGEFVRQGIAFTTPFGTRPGELPVEAGRYRLLWSPVCPWSHRAVIVRSLLGLEDKISLGTVDPIRPNIGRVDWAFTLDDGHVDPVLGIHYISEIYLKTDPHYDGRPTVPVVVDVWEQRVVNNDYFQLTNHFETAWAPLHKENAPDLYPVELREDIDALNDAIFYDVNNGVYKCGFARSQEAYEEAYNALFHRLDKLEERLSTRRFLFGDFITDSDVRLYVTLIRFDVVCFTVFKANRNLILDFPNLWGYLRDLYQTPGFGDTTDFHAIKMHYHLMNNIAEDDQKSRNILPLELDTSLFNVPHNRDAISYKSKKFIFKTTKDIANIRYRSRSKSWKNFD